MAAKMVLAFHVIIFDKSGACGRK